MAKKYTVEELHKCSKQELMLIVLSMQDQLTQMNENLEKLIEQVRIANQQRFGRHSETLAAINGQLSLFNETEALSEESAEEPTIDEALPAVPRKKKQCGKREADLSGFPEVQILHGVSQEKLSEMYGEGSYDVCRMNPTSACATNRRPGLLRYILLKYTLVSQDFIKMNSCAVTGQKIFSETVLSLRLWKQPS